MAAAQAPAARTLPERAATVGQLLAELQSQNSEGDERYLGIRDEYTLRILSEVDAAVSGSVSPRAIDSAVKADLDTLLHHKRGDLLATAVFRATLPAGRFLVAAVEIARTAGAFPDNAFSLRAYRETGDAYVFAGNTNFEQRLDEHDGPIAWLQAAPVPSRPIGAEFWLLTWTQATAQPPPFVNIRLFAFNGESFRMLWEPKDVESDPDKTIKITSDGFIVRSLLDPTGGARGSPTVIVREQYALTIDGPQKVGEWNTFILDEPGGR